MRSYIQKIIVGLQALLLVAPVALVLVVRHVAAATLNSRLVLLSTSLPSAPATHAFSFDVQTAGALGSIEFEYCTNDPFIGAPCTAPFGLDLTTASLSGESGETGFTTDIVNTTANRMVITRPSLPATPQTVTYTFAITNNPSNAKQTVYVRISTFASTNATGPRSDSGTVAFSTSGSLNVGGYVPPFLTLCTGVSVAGNCTSATGSLVRLGELSPSQPTAGTSQFAVATNDPGGYSAFIIGTTLTSGNHIIPALAAQSASSSGTGQFGINLRQNNAPAVGQNRAGSGTGNVVINYNTPNQYKFVSGEQLVTSVISTEFNTFTVSYIVNVPSSQPPGFYTATMTYVATAAF